MDAIPARLGIFVQCFDFILDAGNRNLCGGGIGARADFNFWPVARVFLVYNAAFSQFAMAGDLIYCPAGATIEFTIFGQTIRVPDWMKGVFGLSLPVMANISEVVRGAVQSVPTAQWEAAESLAFSRRQILWQIILPQCFKRMLPPWMNWYAILTMATPLCSLLGIEEIITLSRQAMEAEDNHPELLVPFYGFALLLFFVYCYPIARLTMRLERKYAVKL